MLCLLVNIKKGEAESSYRDMGSKKSIIFKFLKIGSSSNCALDRFQVLWFIIQYTYYIPVNIYFFNL